MHEEGDQDCGGDVGDEQIGHNCHWLLGVCGISLEFCDGNHDDFYYCFQDHDHDCDSDLDQDTKNILLPIFLAKCLIRWGSREW